MRVSARRDERGASAIFMALTFTVLLSIGAFTLDYGSAVHAKRQVQNAADASARSIARDCLEGKSSCSSNFASTSAESAGHRATNAPGSTGKVTTLTGSSVTVEVDRTVDFKLATLLDKDRTSKTVAGTAKAAWDYVPYEGENFLPIGVNWCTFRDATANGTAFPSSSLLIRYDLPYTAFGANTTCQGPSGAGAVTMRKNSMMWMTGLVGLVDVIDLNACNYRTRLLPTVSGTASLSSILPPLACNSKVQSLKVGDVLTVPVYTSALPQVSGLLCTELVPITCNVDLSARVVGYAAFEITGWRFPTAALLTLPGWASSSNICAGISSLYCAGIQGRFVRAATSDAALKYKKAGGLNLNLGLVKIRLEDPEL